MPRGGGRERSDRGGGGRDRKRRASRSPSRERDSRRRRSRSRSRERDRDSRRRDDRRDEGRRGGDRDRLRERELEERGSGGPLKRSRFDRAPSMPDAGAIPEMPRFKSKFDKSYFDSALKKVPGDRVKRVKEVEPALAVADPALVISRDTCGDDLFEELFAIRHKNLIVLKEKGGVNTEATPQIAKNKGVAKKDAKEEKGKMEKEKEMEMEMEKEKEDKDVKQDVKQEQELEQELVGAGGDDDDLYGDLEGGEDLYGDLNTSTALDDSMALQGGDVEELEAGAAEAAQQAQKEERAVAAPAADADAKVEPSDETDTAHLPLRKLPYALQNSSTARFEQVSHALGGKGASTLFLSLSSRLKELFSS